MSRAPNDGFHRHQYQFESWINRTVPRINAFWQRVTDGLELQELWTQFKAEARASYALYTKEVDWETLKGEKHRRAGKIVRAFFWAMVLKLSPARRVFLLLALALSVLAIFNVTIEFGPNSKIEWNGQFFVVVAVAALVLLLALELADRVTMKRDLEIAREIQRRLVPAEPPHVDGFDIAFATRPANTVAGDYYDAFLRIIDSGAPTPLPSRLIVVVADVAGKGVPAALVMATFQASLRTLALEPTSLLHLAGGLNRYACAHGVGGQRFITAFMAEVDTATRAVTYVNAGHNLPILRRAAGGVERLEAGGLPFGIKPDVAYESGSTTLGHGDLLVVFTDGVVEAENETGEEYGDNRLAESLKAASAATAADQLKNLMASVDGFVRSTRQHDDITCLILQVT